MFWIYILQIVIWYYLLVKISHDILNPFAISASIWFLGAAVSQLRLSELITQWSLETHIVVHIFAYTIILCGFLFSKRTQDFYYQKASFEFTNQYKYISKFFLSISFFCAFLEWSANSFYLPILSGNGSDLKSELIAIPGIHYGTVCFPYFSLIALFELLYDKNSNKKNRIYNKIVIALTICHAIFIQMSRGDLLIIILGSILLIHSKYRIKFRYLVCVGSGVILSLLVFMLVRVQYSDSLVYTAVEGNPYVSAIYMYIATCYANLNSLVNHGSPYTIICVTILKPIFEVLDLPMSVPYLEYDVEFFNARTMIYGFYHDLGIIGIFIYTFIIYSIVGVIYKKAKYDGSYVLLLSALQKSLFVTFFGNYFTGTVCTSFPFFVIWILCKSISKNEREESVWIKKINENR